MVEGAGGTVASGFIRLMNQIRQINQETSPDTQRHGGNTRPASGEHVAVIFAPGGRAAMSPVKE